MIRRISYTSIDFQKYDLCIQNAAQNKYSAFSRFLNVSAGKDHWEILVLGDYEAVMPVPFVQKYGLKWVTNPKLCQQLGVFSKIDNVNINEAFLHFFNKNYRIVYYGFNEFNQWKTPLKLRKNYIIPKQSYEEVFRKYSPKRKRKLRLEDVVAQNSTTKKVEDLVLIENFIKQNLIGASSTKDLLKFIKIYQIFFHTHQVQFYGFYYHEKLINLLAIYKGENSVALLGTFNQKETIKLNGSSVLMDKVIQEFVAQYDFDFEGSEVPAIEAFFRGFRPVEKPYPYFENISKKWYWVLLKKIQIGFSVKK